jgi:hypothetical protein
LNDIKYAFSKGTDLLTKMYNLVFFSGWVKSKSVERKWSSFKLFVGFFRCKDSPVARLAILRVDVGVCKQRSPLHVPQRRSSGPITGAAHADGDQASSNITASLGHSLPEIESFGENRSVQGGTCSRCAMANCESRMMMHHILQTPMHRSKQLAGSLKNTCSMSSLGREFMMHFSFIARLLVLLLGAILTTIQLVFIKRKAS